MPLLGSRPTATIFTTLAGGVLLALGASVPLARGDAKPSTIAPSEIHEGMKGYGLTVFKGTQPERFDVEVIGVLHHFRPGQPLIVIKTPNPRLDIVKTVRGMSGSPIYLDGRLAGAYSYSLSAFEVEPVAGRDAHRSDADRDAAPDPPGLWPALGASPMGGHGPQASAGPGATPAASGFSTFDGAPGHYDLLDHARQLAVREGARPEGGFVPAATPLDDGGRRRSRGRRAARSGRAARPRPVAGGRRHYQRSRRAPAFRQRRGSAWSSFVATSP